MDLSAGADVRSRVNRFFVVDGIRVRVSLDDVRLIGFSPVANGRVDHRLGLCLIAPKGNRIFACASI
jgi:hypothetical protein